MAGWGVLLGSRTNRSSERQGDSEVDTWDLGSSLPLPLPYRTVLTGDLVTEEIHKGVWLKQQSTCLASTRP